jgi:chromosome segregation ATPase
LIRNLNTRRNMTDNTTTTIPIKIKFSGSDRWHCAEVTRDAFSDLEDLIPEALSLEETQSRQIESLERVRELLCTKIEVLKKQKLEVEKKVEQLTLNNQQLDNLVSDLRWDIQNLEDSVSVKEVDGVRTSNRDLKERNKELNEENNRLLEKNLSLTRQAFGESEYTARRTGSQTVVAYAALPEDATDFRIRFQRPL